MKNPVSNLINRNLIIFLTILLSVLACEKFNKSDILGTWISTDYADTLEFVDNSNFYRSTAIMHHDHYDYRLEKDSIEIRYRGYLYIWVEPTKHSYELNGNILMLDLTNTNCYGFNSEKIFYNKE